MGEVSRNLVAPADRWHRGRGSPSQGVWVKEEGAKWVARKAVSNERRYCVIGSGGSGAIARGGKELSWKGGGETR